MTGDPVAAKSSALNDLLDNLDSIGSLQFGIRQK